MTVHLSILLWLPAAFGLAGALLGRRIAGWAALTGAALALAYSIVAVVRFKSGGGLQFVTDESWISALGTHWKLGVDGLNLFLVLLTTIVFTASTLWASFRNSPAHPRPGLFFFWLGLAHSAVLGALLAQDLLVFALFFDLMLVPFLFLTGIFGGEDRVSAVIRLFIYTLVDGTSGVVRAGSATVRALQSGLVRAYASLLVLGAVAVGLYFLVQS